MWKLEKIDLHKWGIYWSKVNGANMLQSCQYGTAKQNKYLQQYNYLILDENDVPQGLVQFLVREILFVGGVARINRGPLFFNNDEMEPNKERVQKTLLAIKNKALCNRWWYIRFAPELKAEGIWDEVLKNNKMNKINSVSQYGSLLLSLEQNEEEIFTGLKGKWRNLLRKSMSFDTEISRLSKINNIDGLITKYNEYQKLKGFTGIPENLLRLLAKQEGNDWDFRILGAYSEENKKEAIAFLVSVRHGDTSTYLIGMSDLDGRKLNANYLLLWTAILDAKSSGCKYFDLGGLDDETTKGVAQFKKGTGGTYYKLVGEWHWFIGLGEIVQRLLSKFKILSV